MLPPTDTWSTVLHPGAVLRAPARRSHDALLFWMRRGSGRVHLGARIHEVSAGHALLIPGGLEYRLESDPESVAIPLVVSSVLLAQLEIGVPLGLRIPEDWEDALIHEFARNLGYLREDSGETAPLRPLLAHACASRDREPVRIPVAPFPRSGDLIEVAEALGRDPEPAALGRIAASLGWGKRSLERRFSAETGLSPAAWVKRRNIAAAMTDLGEGRDLLWVAQRAGFATLSGFTRAFSAATGTTPGRYRAAVSAPTNRGLTPVTPPPDGPAIPGSTTWSRVNGAHVAVWVYRGTAEVRLGGRMLRLEHGDAIVLPAGAQNGITLAPGSILLPLGFRPGATVDVSLGEAQIVHIPRHHHESVLRHVMMAYTALRPTPFIPNALFDAVLRVGERASPARTTPLGLAASIARTPGDNRSLGDFAEAAGVDPDWVRNGFRAATGARFDRWRTLNRMTHARAQLERGLSPTVVARNLGYAHLSAFTRAFRSTHGRSPQEYAHALSSGAATRAMWREQAGKLS